MNFWGSCPCLPRLLRVTANFPFDNLPPEPNSNHHIPMSVFTPGCISYTTSIILSFSIIRNLGVVESSVRCCSNNKLRWQLLFTSQVYSPSLLCGLPKDLPKLPLSALISPNLTSLESFPLPPSLSSLIQPK